jgi:arylsulfatase A-like enzyme
VAGGRVLGRTNALGTETQERPVSVQDLFATVYGQLGVDPSKKYMTPAGRPVKILEGGDPVKELLA